VVVLRLEAPTFGDRNSSTIGQMGHCRSIAAMVSYIGKERDCSRGQLEEASWLRVNLAGVVTPPLPLSS
jgi:hypothetical protein